LRVYLAPSGIGLGHVTRAHPIAKELNRRHNTTAFSTYLDGLQYAKEHCLPTFEAAPVSYRVTKDGTIDFKMTAATSGFSLGIRTLLRQLLQEMRFMKAFKPNIVFSDSRVSSLLAAWLLRIPVVLMLNQFRVEIIRRPSQRKLPVLDRLFFFIANLGWLFIRTAIELVWGRSKIIIIPDLPHPYTISLGNLAFPKRYKGKIKLIGPIVENLSEGNRHSMVKKELKLSNKKPVIYAAISGPKIERKVLATILIEALSQLTHKYDFILSKGEPNGSHKSHPFMGMRVFDWIQNQDDYVKASDVIVARAGHGTVMKSLVFGKPMLLIPIPDHTEQYGNARRAESLKVAKVVNQNELNSRTLDSFLQELMKEEYRGNAIRISQSVSSLRAIQATCDIIENLALP
jgi:UDP:flavonoid glycosyltransferase YjiC (YdhE family)